SKNCFVPIKYDKDSVKYPIHPLLRITLILLLISLSVVILKYGKLLLMPLALAAILAMLMSQLVDRILKVRLPDLLSVTLLTHVLLFVGVLVFYLIGKQIGVISQDWPQIRKSLMSKLHHLQQFLQQTFDRTPSAQENQAKKALPK